jgi:hypothetical protein
MRVLWSTPGPLATTMNALTFALLTLGTAALGLVVWRVFRPGKGWGAALCAAGCGLILLAYAVRLWDGDFVDRNGQTRGYLLHITARGILIAWTATEAIHYWSLLRRRLALGLADPVATNQILLWGISGIFAFGGTGTLGYARFVLHQHPLELFGVTAVLMVMVVGASVSMWCAFFPPGWLSRRVERVLWRQRRRAVNAFQELDEPGRGLRAVARRTDPTTRSQRHWWTAQRRDRSWRSTQAAIQSGPVCDRETPERRASR